MLQAQLAILQQPDLYGVLTTLARAGSEGPLACATGCFLRDPALDAWYLTALVDQRGELLDVATLGLTTGPFPFYMPENAAPRSPDEMLGSAWGDVGVARLQARLGTTQALCMPVPGATEFRGALVAFVPPTTDALALAGILAHAATAAARHLPDSSGSPDGRLLPAGALQARAEEEIKRAERYGRPLTVVVFVAERVAQLHPLATLLTHTVRTWDLLGRWPSGQPTIVAILPETARAGGQGLVRRLRRKLPDVTVGVATFPDDGVGVESLVERARGRAAAVPIAAGEQGQPPAETAVIWTRGAPAGPDRSTVRCPICLAAYAAAGAPGPATSSERARIAAREHLQRLCPHHPDEFSLIGT